MRFVETDIGVVGHNSFSENLQKAVHKLINSKIPQGWDNQIPNHFAFLWMNQYTTHIYENKYFAIDPYAGCYMGNLADSINAGFNVYAGYNLPPDRNQHRVIPFKEVKGASWNPYAYVYLGLEPKLMFYNMLLEDKRFTINPELYVYDRNAGLVIGCKYFELAFTFCLRSKEFEEQQDPARYGAAKISFSF